MPSQPIRPRVAVRPATPQDMTFTARAHCQFLPHGLFPLLGEGFVRRWHATFLTAPHGVALVAERTEGTTTSLVGFLVGSVDQVSLVEEVIQRHRWRLGVAGVRALLMRPGVLRHFLSTRGPAYWRRLTHRTPVRPRSTGPGSSPAEGADQGGGDPAVAVVTALVVRPFDRGLGAGEALVTAFVARARVAGVPEAQLTTVAGAQGAGPFYRACGWQYVGEHVTRDGRLMATYRLSVAE